jgi:hypothetical protein
MLVLVLLFSLQSSIVREIITPRAKAAPGDGHMLLFWDGGAAPTGWSCVSCAPGDPFYQVFPRGNETYGGTGGSTTHSHTTTNSISAPSGSGVSQSAGGTTISGLGHTHTVNVTVGSASNLPLYRQLNIIRSDTNAEPATLPAGVIGIFDTTLPSGWSVYTAQNGFYPRGENSVATGGNNTHNHGLTITIGNATGDLQGTSSGQPQPSAVSGHTHTASGNSSTVNHEPPYIEVVFGQLGSSAVPPDGLIAMWDDDLPNNWTSQSGASGSFNQRFMKGASSFGSTGGAETHSHINTAIITSGPTGGSTNSRSGSVTASSTHTHTVSVNDYSNVSNIPPYRDIIIAKRVPQVSVSQSAYRFYKNLDSYDIGAPLASQNTAASSPPQGKAFRLRMLLSVSLAELGIGNKNFKLQYAERSGTCDTSFSGEIFSDVLTNSGSIRYFDNSSVTDGNLLTQNVNDPDIGNSIVAQYYEEENNFSNSATIPIGDDGMWDFSLVDFSAPASTNFCFRVVYSDGSQLQNYTVVPEIVTDDGNGHMLLLYAGATVPTGWECVSCNPEDDFYQRFFRGAANYGATGGSETHTHTADGAVGPANDNSSENQGASGLASSSHTHSLSFSVGVGTNIPPYRQLKIIRANTSGVPSQLPADVIAFFDATVPAGWTRYAAQDNAYIRGENTVGTTGGSLTHTNLVSGSLGSSTGGQSSARTNGGTQATALNGHTHTISGNTVTANHEPPFRDTILGQLNSPSSVPQNLIAMWDNPPPGVWTTMSENGEPFNGRFVKPATTYGATGGSETHSHGTSVIASSVPIGTDFYRTGTGTSSGTHTHDITLTNISTESHLPPYIDVIFAKLGTLNTDPNSPNSLEQRRTNDSSLINVGDYSNGGQVEFRAQASDTDNPDDLQLCVEVLPLGDTFTNTPTECGSFTSYTGSSVLVSVTVSGFSSGTSYHWQAQIKDGSGGVSGWVSFGGNAESAADFTDDSTAPSGNVYDGDTISSDIEYNDGSLDNLSANWNIVDNESGIDGFEFSVGTTPTATDVLNWIDVSLDTDYTANGLSLETSAVYYINVRATDIAGNDVIISSNGQLVAPTLSFSTDTNSIVFEGLNPANNYTVTEETEIITSTNARNGYEIRAYVSGLLESLDSNIIGMFTGGSYDNPAQWGIGDTGYGYTSSDTFVDGANRFNSAVCSGGGNSPCFAPFAVSAPGDIVADNPGPVISTPIINEAFTITHRVTTATSQDPGRYQTILIFNASARY